MVSGLVLAYEILLMRLMAIVQYHHFAYLIISLALLGYGASGTVLTLSGDRVQRHFSLIFPGTISIFALSTIVCFVVAQRISFNPEEIFWSTDQFPFLVILYLVLLVPFFFGATAVGSALMVCRQEIPGIYSADLLGAGMGSLGSIGMLFLVFPGKALLILAALSMIAAGVAIVELGDRHRWAFMFLIMGAILLALPDELVNPFPMPYKSLPQQMRINGSRVVACRSSPLGLLTAVISPAVPLRYAPGLSLQSTKDVPEQLAVFTDGNGLMTVIRHPEHDAALAFLDQVPSAAAYHLRRVDSVLVLGVGGGTDVLQARSHGAEKITGIEMNPQMVTLINDGLGDYVTSPFADNSVMLHIAEARGYVLATADRYDLIQISMLEGSDASVAGLHGLDENYLLTVEGFADMLGHLSDGGFLSVSGWVKLPPRDTVKLFATALEALEQKGQTDPGGSIILIRDWQTSTLLVKKGRVSTSEIEHLKEFCRDRSFDTAYYPGMPSQEANRYNILGRSYFTSAAKALLGPDRQMFYGRYKFQIRPATDDRPYFFDFFKWRTLPETIARRGQGGMALLEAGYLVLVAVMAQAVLISVVFILLPLCWQSRSRIANPLHQSHAVPLFLYFTAIGLAFLFLEISFIQKFVLFLGHPLYAAAVVITGFLLFAGLGSRYSPVIAATAERHAIANPLILPVAGIIALAIIYLVLLGPLFKLLLGWPVAARIFLSILIIAPLAICMGIPFPLGLRRAAAFSPASVPWAWGINGCASVISAVLATLLAIHLGFSMVVLSAVLLYCGASFLFLRLG